MNLWPSFSDISKRLDELEKRTYPQEGESCRECGIVDFRQNMQKVFEQITAIGMNQSAFYCSKHRKPYDRTEREYWDSSIVRYIKWQPSEIEVDEKGRRVER